MLNEPMSRPRNGIVALENELLVRDFVDHFNRGSIEQLAQFLHPSIIYRASDGPSMRGRALVLASIAKTRQTFDQIEVVLRAVGLSEENVLVEFGIQLATGGGMPRWRTGFASFQLRDHLIAEWRQMHAA
ncbi:nuclear transport factor 2 family protein [Curtobacterium sp. MCBA15_008]|jgi:hypothetical protein|uniref:nuclear transport factor 2 family protein n=1 Tax=unclassified Curtobacterium TaxID=257496 RepID=UPI0008DD33BE|nr:nuclear transport factor 2 family protein [Curtobacterium sp. MCBA15_008]OII06975.1 hypothetical protein BIU96_05225 [Curtobacterium sp. MCBA15_008]